jgi:hypothetical protein
MTHWQMYWFVKLGDIGCMFGVFAGILLALFVFLWFSWIFADMEGNEPWKSVIKKASPYLLVAGIACIFIATFIPSTKQMAAIIVIPKIVNNEQIQNIGENGLSILESKTVEWLKDIKKIEKPPQ